LKIVGSIRDKRGLPIPNASVIMTGAQQGTSTDSLGNFSLAINPGTQLTISAAGFEPEILEIDREEKVAIVLRNDGRTAGVASSAGGARPAGDPTGAMQALSLQNSLADFSPAGAIIKGQEYAAGQNSNRPSTIASGIMSFSSGKDDTKGSKFLFKEWCHGVVADTSNRLVDNRYYLFNYNKMSNALMLTMDMQSGVELYKTQIRQFELKDESGHKHVFVLVPGLNNDNFVECLANGNKYSLYKVVNTKFKKADYRTDGLTESGNNYDEYIDDITYYVTDGKGGGAKKLELKKKSLLAVFAGDKDKVDAYLKKNSYDDLDAAYVQGVVDYLNQP
jgi:hypothetical protein